MSENELRRHWAEDLGLFGGGAGMSTTVVINFQHVERMKLTNETTVYVQFASGTTRIFEFIEPTLPAKIIVAFENWLDQRHQYGGYVVKIGQDGKASGKQCLKQSKERER